MPDTDKKYSAPPHIKVQRAKVVILPSGQKLILKNCAACMIEFYGTEIQIKCDECRKKKRASR